MWFASACSLAKTNLNHKPKLTSEQKPQYAAPELLQGKNDSVSSSSVSSIATVTLMVACNSTAHRMCLTTKRKKMAACSGRFV